MPAAPDALAFPNEAGAVRLDRIEVENFKSYAGRQVVGPLMDMNAVVGPNGSGKSNLMDMVAFSVGLSSSDLRGKTLKDLVYRNSPDEDISERGASVSLVVTCDGAETRFTRSITPAGVGKYSVNGKTVSAQAYDEKLKTFGVISKAHNGFLVFQGYVSELAQKSAKELSRLFEQISGSEELAEEYDALAAEKKRAEEEQIFNQQRKRGLTQERHIMKRQKEEAEAYQALLDRKRELQQLQYLQKLYGIEREIVTLREQLGSEAAALEAESERHATAEATLRASEKERARLARRAVDLERQHASLLQKVERQNPGAIKLREEIKHVDRRRATQAKSLDKVEEAHRAATKQQKGLEKQLADISDALARATAEQQEAESRGEVEMNKRQRDEYSRLKGEAGAKSAALHEQLSAMTRELRSDEPLLMQGRTRLDELAARRGVLEGRQGGFKERRKGLAERVATLKAEAAECEKELQAAKTSGSTSRERQAELRETLVQLTSKLSASKAEQRESERERKSAEALDNLKRLIPGTFGRTFDLCKTTHRKYNTAVTIAMGKAMDAIVVEEEGVAKEAIKYLKAQKCAPETFVPLDSIRVKAIPERLRRLGGTKRPILDVISVSDKFSKAVQYAVGDTVVCDTLDEARQLAYHSQGGERYKVVTLDGTLINKAGLMTGGASHQDAKRANKWNDKEHQALKARAEEAQRELASLGTVHAGEEAEAALQHKLEQTRGALQSAEADLQLTSSKEKKLTKELADLAAAAKAAEAELRSLEKKRDARQKEVDALTSKANAVEDAVFADFSKSLNLSSVREYEQRQLVEEQQKEGRVLELQAQYDKLNSRLQFEQRKDLPRAIEKLRAAIAADDAKLKAKRAEQAKIEEKSETLRAQAATTEAELAAAKEEQDAKAAETKKLKKELRSLSDERARLQARQAQLETDIQQLRSSRQRTFQTARLQEVRLPVLAPDQEPEAPQPPARQSGSGGGGGGGGKRRRGAQREAAAPAAAAAGPSRADLLVSESFSPTGLVGTGTIEGGSQAEPAGEEQEEALRVDFSSLAGAAQLDEAGAAAELLRVTGEIEGMAPNMKAIEQFEEVQERLHAVEGEWDTSRSAARTVSQRFSAVQAQRVERFMSCFSHVSKVIDDVYKELTKVEGVPLGGTAFLSLEDPSEPYLHGIKFTAMPPAKRFRDMEQLSGGERTLAALALLFAMHDYRPSPFFVMDEIDAALDNVNVTSVAKFIRARADEGKLQFVVISLKDNFYEKAQGLVGIYRDRKLQGSNTVTLNLDAVEPLPAGA